MRARGGLVVAIAALAASCSSGTGNEHPASDSGVGLVDSLADDTADPQTDAPLDATDAAPPPGARSACIAEYEPYCKAFAACAPLAFKDLFVDVADCVDRSVRELCLPYASAPGSGFEVDRANRCAGEETAALTGPSACATWVRDNVGPSVEDNPALKDCSPHGKTASGKPCSLSIECASGYCEGGLGEACGTCVDRVAPPSACNGSKPGECASGSTCVKGRCVEYASLGDVCDDVDTFCHFDLACISGKCAARLADGDSCDPAASSGQCAINHLCNTMTSKCEPWRMTGKAGEACGLDAASGGFVLCVHGSKCKITNTSTYVGTCVVAAKPGDACTFNGPYESQCEYPAACIGGVCALRRFGACG